MPTVAVTQIMQRRTIGWSGNNKYERMCKEPAMIEYDVPSWHEIAGTEGSRNKPRSG
jgi:hypothetical protein